MASSNNRHICQLHHHSVCLHQQQHIGRLLVPGRPGPGTYGVELTQWPDKYEATTPTTIIVDVGPNDFVYFFGLRLKDF